MKISFKTLIIDNDPISIQLTKDILENIDAIDLAGESQDPLQSFELIKKIQPSIVLLDLFPHIEQNLKVAEKITSQFPDITLFVTSQKSDTEIIIQAMRAGAREFITKPLNKEQLIDSLNAVSRNLNKKLAEKAITGKIISIFGVKGGVGTTTIATNLAVNMANNPDKSIILLDLNLQLGNAAILLDLPFKYSIVDIIHNINNLIPDMLKQSLLKHSSGIYLLSGSSRPEESEMINTRHLDQVLNLLRATFDYIIIDTNMVLDDFTLKALDESDNIIAVLEYDLLSIYNTRRCLDIFKRMGYNQDKVLLLVNRFDEGSGLAFQEFKKTVNHPLSWKIPNQDHTNMIKSMNKGIPITQLLPNSKISKSFRKLAIHLNGGYVPNKQTNKTSDKKSFFKKFF